MAHNGGVRSDRPHTSCWRHLNMSPSSDRNFLFALVAYQNGYITVEQFFEAAQAWNRDPKLAIDEILVERKFLNDVERFNIQGIVEDRLRRQGGLDNSLSFVVENGSMPEGQDLPEDWQKRIEEITKIVPDGPRSAAASKAPRMPSIHRYVFRKPIGEGGQGIVWEVDDTELGRRIALKRVHPKHANDPLHSGMLIEESRNTGRLDHAGIVPVYDLGQDDEGNPFFTMQLIRGEKLSERVKAIRYESLGRDEMVNQFRPLLRHLIAACNALQYAYDKCKVIHRDVKPENIMVNRYGETVVMDWGMGKAVEDATQLDEASSMLFVPVLGSGSGVDKTQVGSVKGTLGYLSPEQAQAMNMTLDHRTDIYGLGATLYRILTGTVPYSGTNTQETLGRAKLNQYVRPRERNPRVPRELEAICLKAMATLPVDRYQKATDLGKDLENWLDGEPISVVPDHIFRKAERWLRRNAKGVIASLLLLSLTAAALLWATVAISREKTIVENLNQNLEIEQKKTNASRGVSSDMLDQLVGYVFDDRLSQVPDSYGLRKAILAEFINKIEEPNDGYLARDPDDWNLKLDLVRILTRLANLQRVQEPEQAQLQWDKVDGLIASAKGVSDRNLERTNWQLAEADSKLYYSEFQFKVKQDFDRAQALCDEALEISKEIIRRDGIDDNLRLLQARTILFKSTLFNEQKRYKESLDQTQSAIGILDEVLGDLLTKQSLSEQEERNLQEHVMASLVYMLGLQHQCESLQGLDRRSELEQALVEGVGVSRGALVNPIAKTDASRFALANLTKLISIASKDGRLDQADAYYKDACWWVEQNLGNTDLANSVLSLEIVRAKVLLSTDVSAGEASLGRVSQMIESMRPSPTEDRRAILEVFLGQEIDYLDAKLALASAKGEQQLAEEIRRKLGEVKQRQEQILQE